MELQLPFIKTIWCSFKSLVLQIGWLYKTSCCHFSFYTVTHVLNEFDEWNTIIVLEKYIFYFVYDFSNETLNLWNVGVCFL